LSTAVESAVCVVSFVKLTVADLDNIWHNDQLKKSSENIYLKLQPKVFLIQMNLDTSKKELGKS
jgi:hypothetical protein